MLRNLSVSLQYILNIIWLLNIKDNERCYRQQQKKSEKQFVLLIRYHHSLFYDESRKKKWVQSVFCWNSKYVFCWNSAPSQWSMLCLELKNWGCVPASSTLPTPNKDRVQLSHQPHSASFKAEIYISVSKLLGLETFAKSLRVSVSISKNLVSKKSLGFGFEKNWSR